VLFATSHATSPQQLGDHNSMAKATIFARQSKKDSADTVPLYLRVTHQGRRARLSLDMRVKPRHLNKTKGRVRASHPQQTFLNQYLSDVQASADAAIAYFKGKAKCPLRSA
jgi:hypothetical protein